MFSRRTPIIIFAHLALVGLCQAQEAAQPQTKAVGQQVGGQADPLKSDGARLDPVLRRVRQLSDELRSPFCPGKTLMTCTSSQAFDLRREMEAMIRTGKTDAEIIVELKKKYGDDVSNPQQPWYTFFVPFLPFIVLAGLLLWVVRRWRRKDDETEVGSADMDAIVAVGDELTDDADRLARLRARVKRDED